MLNTEDMTTPPPSQQVCPNCGYCPHCGRGGYQQWPQWTPQPWWNGQTVYCNNA